MTILLASHDPQIAARSERLIRLRDGAVVDDIQLTGDRPVQDVIRNVGQLGCITHPAHPANVPRGETGWLSRRQYGAPLACRFSASWWLYPLR